MKKRLVAHSIQAMMALLSIWAIGAAVRGPNADPSVSRDLAVGGSIVGGAMAIGWSARELSEEARDAVG